MPRIMGLDLGEATVGVAVSDELRITAQPVTTIRRQSLRQVLRAITDLVATHEIEAIVVGLPLRLAGDEGQAAEASRAFAARLERTLRLPIHTWDERLSTVQAERSLLEGDTSRRRRREVINQVAAAIILQSFLDYRRQAGA